MIALEQVFLSYTPQHEVLRDVSLTLEQGSFHFLAGPSGAGKSTLLSIIALQQRVSRGVVRMFGEEASSLPREALPHLRRKIGLVLQDFRLLSHLTVAENVALPLKVAGEPAKQVAEKVHEMLEWIGLGGHAAAAPETLSGGQKQRVAVARAVITRPDILLADEPTGNLDAVLAKRFMYLFEALNEMGTTVLFATHDEHLMAEFKHPVLRLKDGGVKLS